jgi:hypothetical protein
MIHGHEYVAYRSNPNRDPLHPGGNCLLTHISDAAGLPKILDNLSAESAIARLSQTCERWIYSACLCFGLDLEEQERSGFRYQFSFFQVEYGRNLWFEIGGQMEKYSRP